MIAALKKIGYFKNKKINLYENLGGILKYTSRLIRENKKRNGWLFSRRERPVLRSLETSLIEVSNFPGSRRKFSADILNLNLFLLLAAHFRHSYRENAVFQSGGGIFGVHFLGKDDRAGECAPEKFLIEIIFSFTSSFRSRRPRIETDSFVIFISKSSSFAPAMVDSTTR